MTEYAQCPNCDREFNLDNPTGMGLGGHAVVGHAADCMLRAFLAALAEREDHSIEGLRLEPININDFWDKVNPVTDWLEDQLGLKDAPETLAITRMPDLAKCDDCGRTWAVDELNEPTDLEQRLDPGGTVPAGECPDCGSLAYPLEPK